MFITILLFLFFLGTTFGSFGSVLVWRFMTGKSPIFSKIKNIVFGRSKCTYCGNVLLAKDLIPIFSWLFLKGKCRYCKGKISIFYTLMELFSGLIFVFSFLFLYWGWGIDYTLPLFWLYYLIIVIVNWILFLLVIGDFWFYYLVEPLWIFLFFWIVFFSFYLGKLNISFFSGIVFLLVFLLIYFFGKFYVKIRFKISGEGFGFGDVMVAFLIGLSLPLFFNNLNIILILKIALYFIVLSTFIGLIMSIFYILNSYRKQTSQTIPFLPAMIIAWYILQLIYMLKIDFF